MPPNKYMHIGETTTTANKTIAANSVDRNKGFPHTRATDSLTAASAQDSQENGGTSGDGNSAFADPDAQVNIFGFDQGAQPSGLNGSAQFGPQQSQLTRFKHFQSNGLSSPPDSLARPSN